MKDLFKGLEAEEKNDIRKEMGTLPEMNMENKETKFYVGAEGMSVEMFDHPGNYAKTIVEHVTSTWGDEKFENKWPKLKPHHRFAIVNAVLTGQTLPQSLEALSFSFTVRGATRAAFDQHARQRVGAFFQSQGVRDNSRLDAGFRIPNELANDKELRPKVEAFVKQFKDLYQEILKRGAGSFQTARCVMPMNVTHNYRYGCNFMALRSYCMQRLMACEMFDTVQTAILIREQVESYSPLLASCLRPRCDLAKKCVYHQDYTLSEAFGCLFKGCGRWPDDQPYATFNWSCSDYAQLHKESGVKLPDPNEWKIYDEYEKLDAIDKKFFEEE